MLTKAFCRQQAIQAQRRIAKRRLLMASIQEALPQNELVRKGMKAIHQQQADDKVLVKVMWKGYEAYLKLEKA